MIKLIVGLGNPGDKYAQTRHNVGAWMLTHLTESASCPLKTEKKLLSHMGVWAHNAESIRLIIPTTYMNLSGQAVQAVCHFYKISPQSILVLHDELDFPAGVIKYKSGGGHGGHNGLRSITQHLKTSDFQRIRIGIGHPGHRDQVSDYVLSRPSRHDANIIQDKIAETCCLLPQLLDGRSEAFTKALHTSL